MKKRSGLFAEIKSILGSDEKEIPSGFSPSEIKLLLKQEHTLQAIGASLYSLKRSGLARRSKRRIHSQQFLWFSGPDVDYVNKHGCPQQVMNNQIVLDWWNSLISLNGSERARIDPRRKRVYSTTRVLINA